MNNEEPMCDDEIEAIFDDAQAQAYADLKKSLGRCNIGSRFATHRLDGYGEAGAALSTHFTDSTELSTSISVGNGFIFQGSSTVANDLLSVTLKAYILMGIDVYHLTPDLLITMLDNPTPAFEKARVIGISRMFDSTYTSAPLSSVDRFRAENYLITMLDDNVPILVSGLGTLRSGWWSPTLVDLIQINSRIFTV